MQTLQATKNFESDLVEMEASVETNCPGGTDHEGVTRVLISSSTGIEPYEEKAAGWLCFTIRGDDEAYTLARVLRWLGYELEAMLAKNDECREVSEVSAT